ncbi:MAG TPA: type IV pilin protein [Paraburkholderia sp.]|jgi:type IV pilus assembly protein PilE
MKLKTDAFTLLELVIALAIIAALATFAVPSYRGHALRANRMDAAAALYRAAQFIESRVPAGVTALPPGLDQAPLSGTPIYRLHVLPSDDINGGYAVEARPADAGPMRDDECGTFVLDGTGARTNRAATSGAVPAESDQCWRSR